MGKSSINGPFSMAMSNNQRVPRAVYTQLRIDTTTSAYLVPPSSHEKWIKASQPGC